jgi:hypothetical protein
MNFATYLIDQALGQHDSSRSPSENENRMLDSLTASTGRPLSRDEQLGAIAQLNDELARRKGLKG